MASHSYAGSPQAFLGWVLLATGATFLYSSVMNKKVSAVLSNTFASHTTGSGKSPSLVEEALFTSRPFTTGGSGSGSGSGSGTVQASYGATGSAATVISWAQQQIGKPYLWGGIGPSSFDCSGLTAKAYDQVGVKLPHNAKSQYAQTRQYSVSKENPPVGSLVFFGKTAGSIHHVGLAVGGRNMLNAPHTGAKIRVEPFFSDYFAATNPLGNRIVSA